jgi:hypothetical protein
MTLQTSNTLLAGEAFSLIRNNAANWKAQAQNANASLAAGPVDANFIFRMLDELGLIISALTAWKAVTGLDTYATGQGYVGTMSSDCTTTINAAQACINWVITNFPVSTNPSAGFLLSETLNSNGTRTPRSFTSAQTSGLQTTLTSLVATMS